MSQPLTDKKTNYISLGVNLLFLFSSLLFIYIGVQIAFSFILPDSIGPLTEVSGKPVKYEITTVTARGREIYNYIIKLENDQKNYKVYENPLKYFNYKDFAVEAAKGKKAILHIKKEEKDSENIEIIEIEIGGTVFLTRENYVKSYSENRIYLFIAGLILILFGLILAKGSWKQVKQDLP